MAPETPRVEPLPGEPAAVAETDEGRVLVLADYHAGLEVALRHDGVELGNRADERRESALRLLAESGADRVVLLGDVGNAIGDPNETEQRELDELFAALTERVPVTVTPGNHDGGLAEVVADLGYAPGDAPDGHAVTVTDAAGTRVGGVGFAHGHTWPGRGVVEAPVVCTAHEHPVVRLEDEVGGRRVERAWLRGRLAPDPFVAHAADAGDESPEVVGDLVVCPAFNDLTGGTWVNEGQDFLSPFLPEGLVDGEAYLLDGTRLGEYQSV
ncbi:metallophosphoesterase [Haloglomus salinum]|uniref:metallophosphoesterase n=1 Tax=Haloglomus salinum TaxID=2962673 RepID=UPI0020C9C1E1|nr:metallophosphoesterase [Haloglomus salinum]